MITLDLDDVWNVKAGGSIRQLMVRDVFRAQYSSALHDWDECQLPSGEWVSISRVFLRYGRYCLLANLGAGSYGCVFKAWDLKVDVIVAVKTVHEHLPDDVRKQLVRVFVNEAFCTAQLAMSHHVVKVLALDYETPYLVIEYCDGGSLAERMKSPYGFADVVCWARQLATAIADAHALTPKHVVHHDLKPHNLLLSNGALVVSDFGGAMMMWECVVPQSIIDYGFTRLYAAPEVYDERLRYPKALDVWSLGVILWELVSGTRPFGRDPAIETLPDQLVAKNEIGAIPFELEELIRNCLVRNPEKRPSANECVDRLISLTPK